MKTKMLITLSICLLLFACGEKKLPEKKVKQKTVTKTLIKPKQETKKEKVLEALPAKKEEHVHSPGCGHDHGAADSEHVSMMATAQEERMILAEMLPEEIREKIAKLVADRNVEELSVMCTYLANMGNYDSAFLIASNFLKYAETETEKQMAASFYANLSANSFCDTYDSANKSNYELLNESNKTEFENTKTLLIESLENTPESDNNFSQAFLTKESLTLLAQVLEYDMDGNTMYKMYDAFVYKIKGVPKDFFDNTKDSIFTHAFIPIQNPNNYEKVKISDKTLNRMLEYSDKMISGEISACGNSDSTLQMINKKLREFKIYRHNKKK